MAIGASDRISEHSGLGEYHDVVATVANYRGMSSLTRALKCGHVEMKL